MQHYGFVCLDSLPQGGAVFDTFDWLYSPTLGNLIFFFENSQIPACCPHSPPPPPAGFTLIGALKSQKSWVTGPYMKLESLVRVNFISIFRATTM